MDAWCWIFWGWEFSCTRECPKRGYVGSASHQLARRKQRVLRGVIRGDGTWTSTSMPSWRGGKQKKEASFCFLTAKRAPRTLKNSTGGPCKSAPPDLLLVRLSIFFNWRRRQSLILFSAHAVMVSRPRQRPRRSIGSFGPSTRTTTRRYFNAWKMVPIDSRNIASSTYDLAACVADLPLPRIFRGD